MKGFEGFLATLKKASPVNCIWRSLIPKFLLNEKLLFELRITVEPSERMYCFRSPNRVSNFDTSCLEEPRGASKYTAAVIKTMAGNPYSTAFRMLRLRTATGSTCSSSDSA